jgi:proline dehydrogenase
LLFRAAKRFVAGETRQEGMSKALELHSKGYYVSLEYMGENTKNEEQCIQAKDEFKKLIKDVEPNHWDFRFV